MMVEMESSDTTDLYREFCLRFQVTDEDFYDRTRFGFVAGNERDQLEVADCPTVVVIDWTEVEKMAELCCCIGLEGLFWAVFRRLVALLLMDLNSGLLRVLKRVWWQCQSVQGLLKLVITHRQGGCLMLYYATTLLRKEFYGLFSRDDRLFRPRQALLVVSLCWDLLSAVRGTQ